LGMTAATHRARSRLAASSSKTRRYVSCRPRRRASPPRPTTDRMTWMAPLFARRGQRLVLRYFPTRMRTGVRLWCDLGRRVACHRVTAPGSPRHTSLEPAGMERVAASWCRCLRRAVVCPTRSEWSGDQEGGSCSGYAQGSLPTPAICRSSRRARPWGLSGASPAPSTARVTVAAAARRSGWRTPTRQLRSLLRL